MSQESSTFKGSNGQEIFTWCWSTAQKPRGILQIFHGMAEHAQRYTELAQYLNKEGFTVYACDMRGHGRTGELNSDSCHMDRDGFSGCIEDQALLMERIGQEYPGVPLVVLGHSFGSFLAQEFIKHYGNRISGVILSGSSLMKGADISAAYFLSRLAIVSGNRKPGRLINKLSFGSYNKAIKNPSSEFSWLSRDEKIVRKYDEDNFCGNVLSNGFFNCFMGGLYKLYDGMDKVPLDLPVCILSGAEDPVGKYGIGAKKLYDVYRKLGVTDLRIKLYPGARHEIINEINREDVYQDILQWLTEHCFIQPLPKA